MAVKGLGIALVNTITGKSNDFSNGLTYVCLANLIVSVSIQMNYLNKALDTYNTSVVTIFQRHKAYTKQTDKQTDIEGKRGEGERESVCVVYFGQLLGAAFTQMLSKTLFWLFSTFFLF